MKLILSPQSTARVYFPFCLEASAYGLTLGLYLFLYGEFIKLGSREPGFADIFFSILTFSILLFEPITGYVADTRGRAVSLRWSYVFRCVFFLLLLCAWWVGPRTGDEWSAFEGLVLAAAVVFAFSYTLRSGARDAWLHDSLRAIGQRAAYARIYAMGYNFQAVCFVAGSLLGVRLQDAHYPHSDLGLAHIAFLGGALICMLAHLVLFLAMDDPARYLYSTSSTEDPTIHRGTVASLAMNYWRGVWQSLLYIGSRAGLVLLAVAGGFALLLSDASDFLWRALWTEQRLVPFWVVLVVAAAPLGNGVTAFLLSAYRRRAERDVSVATLSYITIGCYACVGVVTICAAMGTLPVPGLVVIIQFCWGLSEAPQSGLLNAWIEHPLRATILSTIEAIRNGMEGLIFLAVARRWFGAEPFSETLGGWIWPAVALLAMLTPFAWSGLRAPREDAARTERDSENGNAAY